MSSVSLLTSLRVVLVLMKSFKQIQEALTLVGQLPAKTGTVLKVDENVLEGENPMEKRT